MRWKGRARKVGEKQKDGVVMGARQSVGSKRQAMVNTVDCWEEILARTQNAHVIN